MDGCTLIQNLHLSCLVIQNSMSICLKIAMFVTKDKIKFFLPHHSKRATRLWQRVEYSFLRELFLDLCISIEGLKLKCSWCEVIFWYGIWRSVSCAVPVSTDYVADTEHRMAGNKSDMIQMKVAFYVVKGFSKIFVCKFIAKNIKHSGTSAWIFKITKKIFKTF